MSEVSEAVRAAAMTILEAALRLLDNDGHSWSNRPCSTCSAVSSIYGQPFGCIRYALEREALREAQAKAQP